MRAIPKLHVLALRIDIDGFAEQHLRIFLPAENTTQGRGNFPRRERTSRDLIEQRLKQVEIAAIDQRDLDRRPF